MNEMGKTFILIGVVLIIVGISLPLLQKMGLGRLPGDLLIKKENFTFYFPLATGLLISLILTIFLNLFGRR